MWDSLVRHNVAVQIAVSFALYARYRQVREYLPTSLRHSIRLNKASLGLGLLSSLGVSIVGNFQVSCVLLSGGNGILAN